MIEINPHTLYTRSDLAEMLAFAGIDVDTFIGRLRPRKVFRMAWFGEDLLTALRNAPALAEKDEPVAPPVRNIGGCSKPVAPKSGAHIGSKLDEYAKTLREANRR